MAPLSEDTLVAQLHALGVRPGAVVEVHTSFRAVGPVEGGPLGLLRALRRAIGPAGTLVMPTMTDGASVYDPATTPSLDMGIVAETFWRLPGVLRSGHPGASFAAAGPAAATICAPQPLAPPHGPDSPPGRVYALGGQVLLLGVGHDADTLVHVAEALAGVPYALLYPVVIVEDGHARTVQVPESDHCCAGFAKLDAWLGDAQRVGPVGHGVARLAEARAVVDSAVARLVRDPLVFLCAPDALCEECDAARASIPA